MATKKARPSAEQQPSVETGPAPKRRPAAFATRAKRKSTSGACPTAVSIEHIRLRAYYLSLERNESAGDAVADWLTAERELTAAANER
ncbi:MAG: DUF2934 domain-containing protein [Acidimicrobiia bacterium]|nr:DUF2934 domain-containing protein [Acidimicrobiia bacterium]